MCYFVSTEVTRKEMKEVFGATYEGKPFEQSDFLNGFTFPQAPVILDQSPQTVQPAVWGLLPTWAKDRTLQKSTLNARLETLEEKPSFKEALHHRCVLLVKGFYEWKWLDARGKQKEKYYLQLGNGGKAFALGGLYSMWQDPSTGREILTFTVVTTDANVLMAEIHNSKDRMPLVLTREALKLWLANARTEEFAFPGYDPELLAIKMEGPAETQLSLF